MKTTYNIVNIAHKTNHDFKLLQTAALEASANQQGSKNTIFLYTNLPLFSDKTDYKATH